MNKMNALSKRVGDGHVDEGTPVFWLADPGVLCPMAATSPGDETPGDLRNLCYLSRYNVNLIPGIPRDYFVEATEGHPRVERWTESTTMRLSSIKPAYNVMQIPLG
eukprot:1149110-Amorphochlora_amoeboformis.AAC.1